MAKYQIRYCDSKGHGYFKYFDADKDIENKAAEVATAHLNEKKEGIGRFNPYAPAYKPKRVINVWEWDNEKKEPKKKGHRFKLELCFIQKTYQSGLKVRDEWYEPKPKNA